MVVSHSHGAIPKLRKLSQLAANLRRGEAFQVTRLTSLKSLCQDPSRAHRFVTYLARNTLELVASGRGRTGHRHTKIHLAHQAMMADAVVEMERWTLAPTESLREELWERLHDMEAEQIETTSTEWGPVRIIHDEDLLLFEYALRCLLCPPHETGCWAYQTARHYAERYDPQYGGGLIPASAPLVEHIVNFWIEVLGVDFSTAPTSARQKKEPSEKQPGPAKFSTAARHPQRKTQDMAFTQRQGQFLAFIHCFRILHRQGPAELDMAKFFGLTPPSVHGMVVKLDQLGLITREPGVARSVRVAIPEEQIPKLEQVEGPAW